MQRTIDKAKNLVAQSIDIATLFAKWLLSTICCHGRAFDSTRVYFPKILTRTSRHLSLHQMKTSVSFVPLFECIQYWQYCLLILKRKAARTWLLDLLTGGHASSCSVPGSRLTTVALPPGLESHFHMLV